MIDIDTEAAQRKSLVELVKEEYGEENVLNICTFTTEAVKSTIVDVCLGYGYTRDVGTLVANSFPKEDKKEWDMEDAFFGNEDKGRKPSQAFIKAICENMDVDSEERFNEIRKCMLDINGLYSGRSQHASGIVLYPSGYLRHNCKMCTSEGLYITQYDADDTEYCGGTKLDFLTISSLDRIRACLDLLLKHGVIEWQGSLRETYNKYLHPKNIDLTNPLIYDMIYSGNVFDLFQFSTLLGASTIKKLNARTFDEFCSANSLMRLTVKDGEQPLDKFIRHRDNPNAWDKEMNELGLTESEKDVLKKYLNYCYGVCSTQEDIMRLIHDPQIGNYTMTQANAYRKLIAKKNQKKFAAEKEIYLERGKQNGNREVFLDYVWKTMFEPARGYAFSHPHIVPYTLIGVQEAYLCVTFGTIFWKTACLLINSGILGNEDTKKSVDYGFIASSIMPMKEDVLPPSINKSGYVFEPDLNTGKIVYGLKTIVGLGKDTAQKIISSQRPYSSLADFYGRLGHELSHKKNILLIKAGCLDEFGMSRRDLMIEYLKLAFPVKPITMTQFPIVIEGVGNIPEYNNEINLYYFRQIVVNKKMQVDKDIFDNWVRWFMENLKGKVSYKFDDNGVLQVDSKSFKKYYDKAIKPLQTELKKDKYAEIVANYRRRKVWIEECLGTQEKWEMQSLNLYFGKHELDNINLGQFYNISSFKDLPEEPTWITKKGKRKDFTEPICSDIAGTVVDKNKDKSTITLLTQTGIVYVKIPRGKYVHYDEKIVSKDGTVLEESWFNKGNILVVTGFRSDEQFMNRKPSNKATSIVRVHIRYDGQIALQQDRYKEENF